MMTCRDKFRMFFNTARCLRLDCSKYIITCYNYDVSCDRIFVTEALSAESAWSNAWYKFRSELGHRVHAEYNDPWLEVPCGFSIPNQNIYFDWHDFSSSADFRHLWSDIIQPAHRPGSVLDALIDFGVLAVDG